MYILNFLTFVAISMVNTQMIPYLSQLGYSVIERGYILAANAIVAILGQFIFGYVCDRFKKIKVFFLVAYIILIVGGFGMFLIQKQMFYYHVVTIAIMAGMVKVIMGLNETWMLEVDEEHYGTLRAAGAFGLTIGSPIAGMIIHNFNYSVLMWTFGFISIFVIFFIIKGEDVQKNDKESIQWESLQLLFKNKDYILLVIIYLFIYMIGTADQYVVIDKMLSINASTGEVGIKWAVQSFMEVPLFLLASKILNKWKPGTLLTFGTLLYGVKFFLYGISWEPWMIIATASLQLVTLPVVMLTSKVMIKEITPQTLCSSAQMFAMAIFIGVSGLVTPIITSYLSKSIGYNWTLYSIALFSILPFLCILYYLHKRKNKA